MDKEMRQQRVGIKEGMRGTAKDSEETGRKAEGRGAHKSWNVLEPAGEEQRERMRGKEEARAIGAGSFPLARSPEGLAVGSKTAHRHASAAP